MVNNKRISELLVKTGAFKDLDTPAILTSGELGIYYINTEKLLQDNGAFEKYGNDSLGMIRHAISMMHEHPAFDEVITLLAETADSLFPKRLSGNKKIVSGGQRRDWLFSGPIAEKLNAFHLAVYKDGHVQASYFSGTPGAQISPKLMHEGYAVHAVDLITEGSSVYRKENEKPRGWVPIMRGNPYEITIEHVVAVVSRKQGGEEMLRSHGVAVHPAVAIDDDFLRQNSKKSGQALAYTKNPRAWSEDYLKEHGALALIESFNPEGGKLDRAKKFLDRYQTVLAQAGRMAEFEAAVKDRYGKPLELIVGGM